MKRTVLVLILFVCIFDISVLAQESKLIDISLKTKMVPSPVEISVLLPPSYPTAEQHFPLLLLLHGGGGSNKWLKRQQPIIEQAWISKKLQDLVVITPSAGRSYYMDYRDGSEHWESFIMHELLPVVRERFNVVKRREGVFIAGSSMGGMGALRMAFKYPEIFEAVVALAPAIEPALSFSEIDPSDRFYRSDEIYEEKYGKPVDVKYWQANHPPYIVSQQIEKLKDLKLKIYIEVGDKDQFNLFRGAEVLHRILFDGGVEHEYHLVHGATHRLSAERLLNAFGFIGQVLVTSDKEREE